jgi:hypothetical protein
VHDKEREHDVRRGTTIAVIILLLALISAAAVQLAISAGGH